MSILIKGMEMPTEDEEIIIRIDSSGTVMTEYALPISWAKAVPVPPHGRLGDLDILEQMFVDIDNAPYSGFDGSEPFYSTEDAAQIIRLAPTVIPASEEEKTKESLCLNCQSKPCWNEGFDTGVHNCKAYSPYQSDTNYSRIRSLSIYGMADELQVLIDEAVWSGEGKSNNELLEWLQSPAEEGE